MNRAYLNTATNELYPLTYINDIHDIIEINRRVKEQKELSKNMSPLYSELFNSLCKDEIDSLIELKRNYILN